MALATSAKAERGADGEVKVIYWQAASTLNLPSGGTKDNEAASLILEPLARYDENGMMVPFLVDSIPTVENGGVSADLRSIIKLNCPSPGLMARLDQCGCKIYVGILHPS